MTDGIWEELNHYLKQYDLEEKPGCVHELIRAVKEEERRRYDETMSVVKGMVQR